QGIAGSYSETTIQNYLKQEENQSIKAELVNYPSFKEMTHDLVSDAIDLGFFPVEKDRKSTRLNSSHVSISYAVFCLKKKKHHRQALQARKNKRRLHYDLEIDCYICAYSVRYRTAYDDRTYQNSFCLARQSK